MVPIAPSIIRMRLARSAFRVASVDIENPDLYMNLKMRRYCNRIAARMMIYEGQV